MAEGNQYACGGGDSDNQAQGCSGASSTEITARSGTPTGHRNCCSGQVVYNRAVRISLPPADLDFRAAARGYDVRARQYRAWRDPYTEPPTSKRPRYQSRSAPTVCGEFHKVLSASWPTEHPLTLRRAGQRRQEPQSPLERHLLATSGDLDTRRRARLSQHAGDLAGLQRQFKPELNLNFTGTRSSTACRRLAETPRTVRRRSSMSSRRRAPRRHVCWPIDRHPRPDDSPVGNSICTGFATHRTSQDRSATSGTQERRRYRVPSIFTDRIIRTRMRFLLCEIEISGLCSAAPPECGTHRSSSDINLSPRVTSTALAHIPGVTTPTVL